MKREIMQVAFGLWMKEKRKDRQLRQVDLAQKTGYHFNSIGRWERGEDSPTLEQAEKIVSTLGGELVIRERI